MAVRARAEAVVTAARLRGLLPAAFLLVVGACMARLTWRTWADPVIDFGRELYVPWRLLSGQHLYSEIAYQNGPLSPFLNALWFALGGVSLHTLEAANGAILIAVGWLLFRLLREVSSRGAATVACATFLILFAFAEYLYGNHNWIAPYSHELTHGIALSLLAMLATRAWLVSGRARAIAAAGLLTGLVFLTKAEVFVAAFGAVAAGLLLAARERGLGRRGAAGIGFAWLGWMLVPPALSVLGLALTMPLGEAFRGTLGTWRYVFGRGVLEQVYFAGLAGLDDPVANLTTLAVSAARWALALGPPLVVAMLSERLRPRWMLTLAATVSAVWAAGWFARTFSFDQWLRPLPLFLLVLLVLTLRALRRSPAVDASRAPLVTRAMLCVFAGLLLAKMALHVKVYHYGFALAMPGTLLLAVTLLDGVPRWLARRNGRARIFLAAAATVWSLAIGLHLALVYRTAAPKASEVGQGRDQMLGFKRGRLLAEAVRRVDALLPPDGTLTCFVDCEMLGYLTRRRNPSRFGNFNPQQVAMFGEDEMVADLERHPPDLVAVVQADLSAYEMRNFGLDYGAKLRSWIDREYEPVGAPIGAVPFTDSGFGIVLLARRPNAADGAAIGGSGSTGAGP